MFALAKEVIGDDSLAVYAVFASFVGLVFADYGGPPLRRATSYLAMVVLGCLVITLGAVLSSLPVVGATGMFVVVFLATMATTFGGQSPLHVAPVALAYSLSVLQPLEDVAIPDRLAGWALGGVSAMVAALVLWPTSHRIHLREADAALADGLAATLEDVDRPDAARARLDEARSLATAVAGRMATPMRPYGPAGRNIALVHLSDHLLHATEIVGDVVGRYDPSVDDADVLAETIAALRRTGRVLREESDPSTAIDALDALDDVRSLGIDRLRVRSEQPADPAAALADVRREIPVLALSHVMLWTEYEAGRAMGTRSTPSPGLVTTPGTTASADVRPGVAIGRASEILLSELDTRGVILQNSVRAGLALAAAVALAEWLPLAHGFWIVLAALCVLRSAASSTYASAIQAVVGTVAGFAVAAVVVATIGDSTTALWICFPVVVAIAAYSPGAIHFAVGQAAFTVLVVVLFGLLDLPGFQTAEVRVATVTVGVLTAVVLSLVIWPRGARVAVARSLAEVYASMARASSTFLTATADERERARHELAAARRRAEAAFAAALAEHREPVDVQAWTRVERPSTVAIAMAAGLIPDVPPTAAGCADARTAAKDDVGAVSGRCERIAARIGDGGDVDRGPIALRGRDDDLASCLGACRGDQTASFGALVLTAWSVFTRRLAADIARSGDELEHIAAAARPRAWLVEAPRRGGGQPAKSH